MDCMIEIKRISENNTSTKEVMHCAKLKDGEAWKDQTFDLAAMGESVRVWWDEPSEASEGSDAQEVPRFVGQDGLEIDLDPVVAGGQRHAGGDRVDL